LDASLLPLGTANSSFLVSLMLERMEGSASFQRVCLLHSADFRDGARGHAEDNIFSFLDGATKDGRGVIHQHVDMFSEITRDANVGQYYIIDII
jgi:hypothetical protein